MTEQAINPHGKFLVPETPTAPAYSSQEIEIASEGEWGVRCSAGHSFRRSEPPPPFGHYVCCGLELNDAIAIIADDVPLITDPANLLEMTWFHAGVSNPLVIDGPIHLGSLRAAQDRAQSRLDHWASFSEPSTYVVQKITLRRDVTIAADVLIEGSFSDHAPALGLLDSFDVVRYINRKEAPGSVSLFVREDAVASIEFHSEIKNGA